MKANQTERRRHRRFDVACPTVLSGPQSGDAKGTSVNVSDGGMLLAMPASTLPETGEEVELQFRVPRRTPNTYLLEAFTCRARVVHHRGTPGSPDPAVGLQFHDPLDLQIEV